MTPENVDDVGIHCVGNAKHPGQRAKVEWFLREYKRGLRICLLLAGKPQKSIGFIEYAPAENTWRLVDAPDFLVVHCVWVIPTGEGHGTRLLRAVVADAERTTRGGVAVVASIGTWCAKPALFEKNGFQLVDRSEPYSLYAMKLRGAAANPAFAKPRAPYKGGGLLLHYSGQCPYVAKAAIELSDEARRRKVRLELREIRTPQEARATASTPYGVMSLVVGRKVLADHAISRTRFQNILRQQGLV